MASSGNKKLRYLKDRSINAYWLLRQGNLRQFLVHLRSEVEFQFGHMRNRINEYAEVGVQSRLSFDSREVAAGTSVQLPDLDSEFIDKRKIQPSSYRPTKFKLVDPINMQADAEVVKSELQAIISSLNVRERG